MQCVRKVRECRRTQADLNDRNAQKARRLDEQALSIVSIRARRTGAIIFTTSLLLSAAPPLVAQAQMIGGSGPLDISGDHTELVQNGKELIFRGRVEALRGQDRLHCDVLQVFFRPQNTAQGAQPAAGTSGGLDSSRIERIVADGDVYIVTGDEVVRGDSAVYTADADTVVTTGKEVILRRGDDVGVGTRLVVQRREGLATLEGGPDGRPRMIIFPKQAAAPSPAPAQ